MFRKISACFAGGALGALVDSINIWWLGKFGITALLGIGLRPEFTPAWLYPRLVWGGLWGLLFMLPLWEKQIVTRGIVFSLAPTAMMLFVVFPGMGKGTYGLGFGILTPILVILLNFIWGLVAAYWYRQSR